jgi:hypothetical protein
MLVIITGVLGAELLVLHLEGQLVVRGHLGRRSRSALHALWVQVRQSCGSNVESVLDIIWQRPTGLPREVGLQLSLKSATTPSLPGCN